MRIVVKVGTSTLAHETGRINIRRLERLGKVLSDIKNSGVDLVLITSGAVGVGRGKLFMREKPKDLTTKQAAAAVGQCELMHMYDKVFSKFSHTTAQILITIDDIDEETHKHNFVSTLNRLLELNVIPIVNENNAIGTHEILIGDNDTISAIVAGAVNADLLVMLTDVDGLYDSNPHVNPDAKKIDVVEEVGPEHYALVDGTSAMGTGGMGTKLDAVKIAGANGCDVIIANGTDPGILYQIIDGENVGTRFLGRK